MSATTLAIDTFSDCQIYSPDQLALLDSEKIPQNIAIIMDGNRRWATHHGLPPMMGHWEGAEVLTDVVRGATDLGVKVITVYSFSTETWKRPISEVEALMDLFEIYLLEKREWMVNEGVRLDAIGDLERLPERVKKAFFDTKKATEKGTKIDLVLAINYGGRDEIRRAVQRVLRDENLRPEDLTEEKFAEYLDTYKWPDPDLLIRTSGEVRVSNFLLWQISYAEIYITPVLWPDFSPKELLDAVLTYQGRQRRNGV